MSHWNPVKSLAKLPQQTGYGNSREASPTSAVVPLTYSLIPQPAFGAFVALWFGARTPRIRQEGKLNV